MGTVLKVLRNILGIPELRRRLIFTIVMLGVYRIGFHIPLPGVDVRVLQGFAERVSGNDVLGLMNVLSKEGASKNVRVNCLAPAAETRLIGTIPGREVNPDNPDPSRHPRLVTPAVLLMCSEDAPNGVTIQAGNGRFSFALVVHFILQIGEQQFHRLARAGKGDGLDVLHEEGDGGKVGPI